MSITLARIYRFSLLLPLAVPLVLLPLTYGFQPWLGGTLGLIVLIIVFSGIIGGVPYAILALWLVVYMRGKTEGQIRKKLLISPLMMLGLMAVEGNIILIIYGLGRDYQQLLMTAGMYALATLIFSYAYVLITFGIARYFRGRPYDGDLV